MDKETPKSHEGLSARERALLYALAPDKPDQIKSKKKRGKCSAKKKLIGLCDKFESETSLKKRLAIAKEAYEIIHNESMFKSREDFFTNFKASFKKDGSSVVFVEKKMGKHIDSLNAMFKLHELVMAKANAERWFKIVESTDDFDGKKEAFDRASTILRNHGDILQIRFDDPDFDKRYSAVKATVVGTNIGVVNANAAFVNANTAKENASTAFVNANTAKENVSVAKGLFDRGSIAEASDIMKGNMVRISESDTPEVKLRAFDAFYPNQKPGPSGFEQTKAMHYGQMFTPIKSSNRPSDCLIEHQKPGPSGFDQTKAMHCGQMRTPIKSSNRPSDCLIEHPSELFSHHSAPSNVKPFHSTNALHHPPSLDAKPRKAVLKSTIPKTKVDFGLVHETTFHMDPGDANQVFANGKFGYCKGGTPLKLGHEAIESKTYPCPIESHHGRDRSHLRLSKDKRKNLYMEMSKEQLVNHICHLEGEMQKSTRENVHLKDKCRMLEGRLGTAKDVFRNTDGNIAVELNEKLATARHRIGVHKINGELMNNKLQATFEENERQARELRTVSGVSNIQPCKSGKPRKSGPHLPKPVETYSSRHKKRPSEYQKQNEINKKRKHNYVDLT